jgi:Baseplate J-like protein
MPIKLIDPTISERDGTSQPGRAAAALLPDYVVVDERSAEDILKFVREYAKTLVYYGEDNQPAGDFQAFLGSLAPSDIAAFLNHPESFDQDRTPALYRPHFTLFMAFLRLLADARGQLNDFTRRHLDFYFRQFLRLRARPAEPDRVNLLLSLAARESRVLVPAGTAATAGADVAGKDRVYRTTRDIVVGRARIEKTSSLYVERSVTNLRKAWHNHRNDPEAGRFEMFSIAYGRPLAGDTIPDYPGNPPITLRNDDELDAFLLALRNLLKFASTGLFLPLGDLRALINLPDTTGDAPEVIANKKIKYRAIIDTIGKKRAANYVPPAGNLEFEAYANVALGALNVPGRSDATTIRTYWNTLLEVEAYFAMAIETFEELLAKVFVNGSDWDSGYERDVDIVAQMLENAYREKRFEERIAELRAIREARPDPEVAYLAMIQHALGDEITSQADIEVLLERLSVHLSETDLSKLASAYDVRRWTEVERLLAHSIFMRSNDLIPEKVRWLNAYPAADARQVSSTRGVITASGQRGFLPFGARAEQNEAITPAPLLGFAITSPVLALSSGKRTITLTLGIRASGYEFNQLQAVFSATYGKVDALGRSLFPLIFEVSTAEGWVRCTCSPDHGPVFGSYDALRGSSGPSNWFSHAQGLGLRIVLTLPENEVPIAPHAKPIDGLDPRFPALRMLMNPVWSATDERFVTYYRELGSLAVGAVYVEVDVIGLAPTVLESDDIVIDPKRPFEPFGSSPASGSRLMIGHPEVVSKRIHRLAFQFQWLGAPGNLADHYTNYGLAAAGVAPNFTVRVTSVDRMGTRVMSASAPLFAADSSAVTTIDLTNLTPPLVRDVSTLVGANPGTRISTWKRRLQWELGAVDFQHRTYPILAAQKSLEFATDTVKKAVSAYQVKPPYTPRLKNISLNYQSAAEVLLYQPGDEDKLERAYHVHPFGVVEVETFRETEEVPLVPRYDQESEFYIGFSSVSLPETVTMLVQLDEGSSDRDIAPPEVKWSQLSGNHWSPLGHKVVVDATRGLQKSGVIAFSLESTGKSTLLPSELTWIRATISRDHAGICDVYTLHTQAVEASFDDQNNVPAHYKTPLPSGSITRLKTPISGIVAVQQPYASYGGRMAEDPTAFGTRVSERLRHKQRALSSWDYERMVLERFPEIFKVKCIPAREESAGLVEVLVIPNVRAVPTNEFGPKAPVSLIGTIQNYLTARAPKSANLRVRNASYRAVRVRLGVRFSEKNNEAYWMGRLNDELNRFLSPWAYDEGADVVVGGRIYASSLVDFVDRRPYVDYVAGISLFYTDDEGERFFFVRPPGDNEGAYRVEAGAPDRVLVAYPHHRIDLLTTAHYDSRLYRGIGYMELEMDFVVG